MQAPIYDDWLQHGTMIEVRPDTDVMGNDMARSRATMAIDYDAQSSVSILIARSDKAISWAIQPG